MSKLPISNTRSLHNSPPIKSRKALRDKTEVMNSPHFSKKKSKSNIPDPVEMIKTRPSRIASGKDTSTRAKFRSLSNMANNYNQGSFKRNDLNMKEPVYVQRQHNLEERQVKMVEVTRDKIIQINKKLKDTKAKIEELQKVKIKTTKDTTELKAKITDLEVHIINLDRKIDQQKINLENSQKHYEQMFMLQIKERQNKIIRELDELKSGFEKELKHAQSIDDKETKKEIATLHDVLKTKETELQKIFDANDKKLSTHRERLAEEVKQLIRNEELKNEEFTSVFEKKSEYFDKLSNELDSLNQEIKLKEDHISKIKSNIAKEKELEKTAHLTTEDLEKQVHELMKQNEMMTENLNDVKSQSKSINAAYEASKSKIDKEKNLRRKIQSTIEELNGKLRVYVRLLSSNANLSISKEDEEQLELQTIRLDDHFFKFNKVFGPDETIENTINETITISENVLKGVDTSFIMVGDNNLLSQLLERTIGYLNKRSQVERYQLTQFSYSFQLIDLDSNISDSIKMISTESKSSLISASKAFDDFIELKSLLCKKSSNCLINIIVSGKSETKQISSNLFMLNISNISLLDQVDLSKPTDLSSPKSVNDMLHVLYINTKPITLLNIQGSNTPQCLLSLQTAKNLSSISLVKSKKKQ